MGRGREGGRDGGLEDEQVEKKRETVYTSRPFTDRGSIRKGRREGGREGGVDVRTIQIGIVEGGDSLTSLGGRLELDQATALGATGRVQEDVGADD